MKSYQGSVVVVGLAWVWACGEVAGDAIVREPGASGGTSPGTGGSVSGGMGGTSSVAGASTATGGTEGCPSPEVARDFVLGFVNRERVAAGQPEHVLDACLTTLAQAGSDETAASGVAQAKWTRECMRIRGNCECGWLDEGQGYSVLSGSTWTNNLERSLTKMLEGGKPLAPEYTRLGIGVYCSQSGQSTILTLDYGA